MSQEFNPFQSPTYQLQPEAAAYVPPVGDPAQVTGLWQDGDLLVMRYTTRLPDLCLKSNLPAARRLPRKLRWHSPVLYVVLFLFGPLIYIIAAIASTKKASTDFPLTEEWFEKRSRGIRIGIASALGGLGLAGFSVWALANRWFEGPALVLILFGVGIFLFGAVYGQRASEVVTVKRMDGRHIWLKGVHPQYLANLPYFGSV